MSTGSLRLRFAPSPTGELHLGNARTALFNYLLAQAQHGTLVLRIEDTDRERSSRESEDHIVEDLTWLGITFDESPTQGGPCAPYRQSEAGEHYAAALAKLAATGAAYPCFCTPEQLEQDRAAQVAAKENPRYVGRCRALSAQERAARRAAGQAHVWRLRYPDDDNEIVLHDLIRGEVRFRVGNLGGDLVLARSDGSPTFHFAVVVDDHRMGITHVLRGEDHLTNTAKQYLLFGALGWEPPRYGHMAMILGPDRTKLSKRHGATTVRHYRELGIPAVALFNYLALLGWSPGDDREFLTPQEIAAEFTLERVVKSAAVFDEAKLLWLSGQHLRAQTPEAFGTAAAAWLAAYDPEAAQLFGPSTAQAAILFQRHAQTFADVAAGLRMLAGSDIANDEASAKALALTTPAVLDAVTAKLDDWPSDPSARAAWLDDTAAAVAAATAAKGKHVFLPLRLALTGRGGGPDLHMVVAWLNREGVAKRIETLRTILFQNEHT